MFDFTKEVGLEQKSYSIYRKLQLVLYLGAFLVFFYLAYLIIFSNQYFTFSFSNSFSLKNTISNPRLLDNTFPEKGKTDGTILFNANLSKDFSKADVNFIINKKSPLPNSLMISARKSYQAFFYPEGNPIGFRDGSLLKSSDNYYLISNGQLRKFFDFNLVISLGYSLENFIEIFETDLKYNPIGQNINKDTAYPDSTLFRIDDNYYALENQQLKKFVSDQAFLSNYDSSQALEKDSNFLNNYPATEELASFSNGTLISNNTSVFEIANGQILPIADIITFESKGFDWNDIIAVGSDEITIYAKGKLFTLDTPHPDGSVFKTIENSKYYIIKDKQKHFLPTENIATSWLKKNPVIASEKSIELSSSCEPKKSILNSNSYSCDIPLDIFENIIGTNYEFELQSNKEIVLDFINVDFKKNITFKNFVGFFSETLNKIKQNYAPTPTN